MTIYSWFLKEKKKELFAEGTIESELLATTKPTNYLDNFTMWPMATMKPNADVTPSNYNNIDKKKSKRSKKRLASNAKLNNIVTK